MKKPATWLLDYAAVKKMGGTNYIEICQGGYAGKCWQEDSAYVYCSLWEDFFDTLSRECIPGYDFFEFTDVAQADSLLFAEQLLRLADRLHTVQTPQDFAQPEWYCEKIGNRYIHIGENIETLVWDNKDEYIRQFSEKFAQRVQAAAQTYRDLAAWLQQNSANGNAILGM
ncbi:MAG: hypothetical protein Q3966_09320 [Neisseria sp.]|nr:hypothetical protein [Neisseria sp.]